MTSSDARSQSARSRDSSRRRIAFLPRFSLKLLLLLGALGSLLLAWLAPDAYWLQREREAIARIQAIRGNVTAKENGRIISAGEATAWRWGRRASDVHYESVRLDAGHGAGDDEAALLPILRGLSFVSLRGPSFTDRSIASLGKLPKLRALSLEDTRFTREGFAELASKTTVDRIYCHNGPASPDLLQAVDALKDVRSLEATSHQLTLPAAEAIAKLERLERVELYIAGSVDPEAPDLLLRLRGLKSLTLHLPAYAFGDDELRSISRMSELESLKLYQSDVTDAGLAELAQLSRLAHLQIGSTWPTNAGVATIAAIPTLERVDLRGWNVDDAALDSLRTLPNLRQLSVDEKISLEALERFQTDRPRCEIHRQANGRSALLDVWLERRDEAAQRAAAGGPL